MDDMEEIHASFPIHVVSALGNTALATPMLADVGWRGPFRFRASFDDKETIEDDETKAA
jgi:hypothetical protein